MPFGNKFTGHVATDKPVTEKPSDKEKGFKTVKGYDQVRNIVMEGEGSVAINPKKATPKKIAR